MRLYSYRGVSYTIAPPSPPSNPDLVNSSVNKSSAEHPSPQGPQRPITQDIFTSLPQTQTPTSAIPMIYRGVMYLLERFHSPAPVPDKDCVDKCMDESPESAKSMKSTDE